MILVRRPVLAILMHFPKNGPRQIEAITRRGGFPIHSISNNQPFHYWKHTKIPGLNVTPTLFAPSRTPTVRLRLNLSLNLAVSLTYILVLARFLTLTTIPTLSHLGGGIQHMIQTRELSLISQKKTSPNTLVNFS